MPSKSYKPWNPLAVRPLPVSPRDWLPDDHLVYFLLDVVEQLDLSAIHRRYQEKDHRGERPWDPRMMVALLLYGYCLGIRSSRRLERATHEDIAFRVLSADGQPDHSSIAQFRKDHLAALGALFHQVLCICQKAGLVRLGRVALDGTKIKANASKHKAMSYGRMKQREQELKEEIDRMLAEAASTDATEDALHGESRRGDELPAELQRRESRLRRIREAKAALEAEAKAARELELAEREAEREKEKSPPQEPPPPLELPSHQVRHDAAGAPKDEAQRNFTDPESRIMKSGQDFVQAYNCQVVVDEERQIIVAAAVTNQPPDTEHLPPMLEATERNCGQRPRQALGDAGYWSEENDRFCADRNIDALISVAREKHVLDGDKPWPEGDRRGAMHAKLRAPPGRAAYARRKAIVEPVFGQIKAARGLRQFLMRGLERVRGEWLIDCLCHNLLKLFRYAPVATLA